MIYIGISAYNWFPFSISWQHSCRCHWKSCKKYWNVEFTDTASQSWKNCIDIEGLTDYDSSPRIVQNPFQNSNVFASVKCWMFFIKSQKSLLLKQSEYRSGSYCFENYFFLAHHSQIPNNSSLELYILKPSVNPLSSIYFGFENHMKSLSESQTKHLYQIGA